MFRLNLRSLCAGVKRCPDYAHYKKSSNLESAALPEHGRVVQALGCVLALHPTSSSSGKRLAYDGHLKSHYDILRQTRREGLAGLGKQQQCCNCVTMCTVTVHIVRIQAPLACRLLMNEHVSLAHAPVTRTVPHK